MGYYLGAINRYCPRTLPSHFLIYCCLLVFSVLLSLQVGGVVSWSYGVIFLPLWVWKTLTFAGTVGGVVVWIRKKRLRYHVFKTTMGQVVLQRSRN